MAPAWVGSRCNIMMCFCWCTGAAFLPEFLWDDTTTAGHNLNNILRSVSVATCMQIVVRNETLRHSASRVMTAAQEAEQVLATSAAGAKASHNTTEEEEGADGDGTSLTVPFEDGTTTRDVMPGDLDVTLSSGPSQSGDVQEGQGLGARPHGVIGLSSVHALQGALWA
jgi:hypothetical protein